MSFLQDFFHTPRNQSKIYLESELDDLEFKKILKDHHETTEDTMIQVFQYYDRLAAQITRNIRSTRTNSYNWYANHTIDFKKIAQEITEVFQHLMEII